MGTVRIFISSPGDVQLERQIARRVLQQLQGELGSGLTLEPYFWEYEPMRLTRDYQSQIPRTSEFDIVVCILWSRLGSALGPEHRRPDGRPYQSGTEFEFEDAAEAFRARGTPDILVYRNRTDPPIKPRPREERERQLAQFDALEAFLERWTREGEVFKGAITGYTDLAQFEELLREHLYRLIRGRFAQEGGEPRESRRVTWTHGSPFRGLQTFEFEHAPVFRGRTRAIQDVIGKVRDQRQAQQVWQVDPAGRAGPPNFVAVSAMSGIGKSSLIRAGVLPLMTASGVIEGVGVWRRAVVTPAISAGGPLQALMAALVETDALPELTADGTSVTRLTEHLRANPAGVELLVKGGLSQAAAKLLAEEETQLRRWEEELTAQGRPADAERCRQQRLGLTQRESCLALVVDQLEELLTSPDGSARDDRDAFFAAINALARSGRVVVLATLRSDFFARAAETPALAALLKEGALYQLQPPSSPELAQIIRDPAREAGLTFEEESGTGERLDDLLLRATQSDPAALPLLEFTLDQLYQRREPNGLLTHRAYRELNGVEGALALRADEESAQLAPEVRASADRAFSALVSLADAQGEERPVRRRAALAEFPEGGAARELVERFARARLLVIDQDVHGEPSVSVVHEALFSRWEWLRTWIERNHDLLRVRGRAESEAARWDTAGRPRDLLLQGGRALAEAQDLLAHRDLVTVSERAAAFIEQSAASDRGRRRRRSAGLAALAAGIAVALVVSLFQIDALNRTRIDGKLLEYRDAVRQAETRFLTAGFAEATRRQALESAQRVLDLEAEIVALRGSPPEQAAANAARAREYMGFTKLQLGDAEGALGDFQAREALLIGGNVQETPAARLPINQYALIALDLQMELFIANEHLKGILRQSNLLREELSRRGVPAPPPSPEQAAASAAVALEQADPVSSSMRAIDTLQSFATLFEYLTREYPRPQDFKSRLAVKALIAREYQALAKCCESTQDGYGERARVTWDERVVIAREALVWARGASISDKNRTLSDAANDLITSQHELAAFHQERREFELALKASQGQLTALDTEPELKNVTRARQVAHQDAAAALAGLGQAAAAQEHVDRGAAAVIEPSRQQLARGFQDLGAARMRSGGYAGAADAYTQALAVLKLDAPPGAAPPNLHGTYLNLSWSQVLARRFRDAQLTAEEGLHPGMSDDRRAELTVNLAHALLFQGQAEQAIALYERWKQQLMPVSGSAPPKPIAAAALEDFDALERAGLSHPAMPAIRASMRAVAASP